MKGSSFPSTYLSTMIGCAAAAVSFIKKSKPRSHFVYSSGEEAENLTDFGIYSIYRGMYCYYAYQLSLLI